MRKIAVLLLGAVVLMGADCLGPVDDDDGEPVLIATASGDVQRLSASETQVGSSWSGTIDPGSQIPVVMDGSDIFVASGQELKGFDADTGDELWEAPVSFASGVVELAGPGGGAVFVQTLDVIVGIQVADGAELWRAELIDLDGVADDALAFGAGGLFVGGDPIRKLDAATGEVDFEVAGDQDISDVGVGGSLLYVGSPDGVQAFSTANLAFQWDVPTDDEVDNLVVGDLSVFYSVLAGGVGAVTLSGNPVGQAEPGEVFVALAIGGNLLLGARSDGTLLAFDENDLAEAWSVGGFDSTVWDLSTNEQTVFFATGGNLDGLNLEDSSSLWSYQATGEIRAAKAL